MRTPVTSLRSDSSLGKIPAVPQQHVLAGLLAKFTRLFLSLSTTLLGNLGRRTHGEQTGAMPVLGYQYQLRRIVYVNPEDGSEYSYLTNDFTIPAGLLVLLYKHRWDIEKIFHQFKIKLNERKSWASAPQAKQSHALFECLAHNLLLLLERHLIARERLRDEVEARRQEGRGRPPVETKEGGVLRSGRSFINSAVTRATQRTQRFIRWVRGRIYQQVPWSESLARLRVVWGLPG